MKNIISDRGATLIFSIPFLVFGIFHLMNADKMAGIVPSYLPSAKAWVYLTGLANLAAALAFIINKKVKLAGYLVALMLVLYILLIHLPGVMSGDEQKAMMAMPNLLKDLGLAGGAILAANRSAN